MSEEFSNDMTVTIRTDETILTLTPRGLIEHYLPGATEIKPGLWKGKSSTGKDIYLHREALAGALMDCKEKRLNAVTEIYMIPATSPERRSSHKIKYTVGLERMRDMPGFLGINSGLVVERNGNIERRNGRMPYPGDTVLGAWAKAYFTGLPEPLEHEVDLASCENENAPTWKERPGFMLLKVVEDELWRLKVLPRFKPRRREELDAETIVLEGGPLRVEAKPEEPKPGPKQEPQANHKVARLNDKQLKLVILAQKESGIEDEIFKDYLVEYFQVKSRAHIPADGVDEVLAWLKSGQQEQPEAEEATQ